ncbi:MAG TPA: efflux RND transporter permease subunit [Pirellulaceae bacterium]|nr:efflux RND transporter permease subunit [Pirellulaceae bacterium]HMO92414.1 efflux RND transporter permease subunit [Pirellulaceae bacterium]HMP69533.1 efflux RND transporter permease subunit [Pirellulaceae bacterium]
MLEQVIEFSLKYRLLIVCSALAALVCGAYIVTQLSIDVLPNLTRPSVTIITECPGMSPEEVEFRVSIPIENALNGATDVIAVRSSSDIGLSVIQVEFDWGQEIFRARQIVQERLVTVLDQLPAGVQPQMAPIASLLGQIMLIGMWSESGETDAMELRTQADWRVAQRLRSLRGIAQVITMGGGRKQVQVIVDFHKMHMFDVTLSDIETAILNSNLGVTGGFVSEGHQELLVRGLGRIHDVETLGLIVIKTSQRRPVLLADVAEIADGPQAKRGDSSINGRPSIVMTVQKQPDADTRQLTEQVLAVLEEIRPSLSKDIVIRPTYEQREFIDLGVSNVLSALYFGAVLVIVVLWLFLANLRTTLITVVAIPLSLAITGLVFYVWDLSINVMTLGGLALGLGMLVDDAIVGVENTFNRLRQHIADSAELNFKNTVLHAMREVTSAIVISTVLVVVVFAPLLLLAGMEGRLFTPLAIAYMVSIFASTVVALTVTPALSLLILPRSITRHRAEKTPWFLAGLKRIATPLLVFFMKPIGLLTVAVIFLSLSIWVVPETLHLKRDFLPAFDEGATQINLYSAPGTSLDAMVEISRIADERFQELLKSESNPRGPLADFTCKVGRAELDEHIMGVNVAEYVMALNPDSGIPRTKMIELLTEAVDDLPGIEHEIEQPIAHLISHMLSGVAAQIAIKIYGDDLDVLKRKGEEVRRAIASIPGLADPFVEQQQIVPQLRFEIDYLALADHGVTAREITNLIETAMQGRVVSQISEGQRLFDVVVRLDDDVRLDLHQLHRLHVDLPNGSKVMLGELVNIEIGGGPNTINRENARRRVVIRVNTLDGDLGGIVEQIRRRIQANIQLPEGYYVTYGGQFEARQTAQTQIVWLSLISLLVVMAVLYSSFPSVRIVIQILIAVPIAFLGGAAALVITQQSMSIAAIVGFVSLAGIATRNGLLLIGTYQNLIARQGINKQTILQGSLERLAPVLMSSLTTGLGLLPLVIGGTQPGKEILYPVATVIVGGLVTSTLCEFLLRPGLFWYWDNPQRD